MQTRTALDAHDPSAALRASNAALQVKSAEQTPEPLEKNDALLLLDRAMVLMALGEHQSSSRDFIVADKALEVLDFSRSTANEITRYLFTDSAGPYKARPYEKLMLNTLNMLNFLVLQDLEGAKVEARRYTIMRDYLSKGEPRERDDGPARASEISAAGAIGSYLAGYTYEKAREPEEALRYYDETLLVKKLPSLAGPVRELMQRSRYRTSRLEEVARTTSGGAKPDPSGEILVVVNHGRVPAMVARRVPIGLALTVAAAFLPYGAEQQARRLAGQGLVTWVNFPELGPSPSQRPVPTVKIDDAPQAFESVANVDALARQAWEESRGRVMAAAVVRMIARAAIGAGVGVAAGKGSGKGSVGMLAALVTQASLAAGDKPDTRSWATLPARIGLVRLQVPPGTHVVEVDVGGRRYVSEVTLAAGQWAVVDVTDLSNG